MTVQPQYHDDFGDITLDIEPFTGWNWKSTRMRDQYASLVDRMKQLRGEAEWRSVADDDTDRQIAIINLSHSNMETWLDRVASHDLHYKTIRYNEPYEGFAHGHRPTSPDNPQRLCFGVLAENEDLLDTAEEAELEYDPHEKHDTLGELLGFPDCCREFFQDVWLDGSPREAVEIADSHSESDDLDQNVDDPMYEVACNTPSAERIECDDAQDHVRLTDPSPWVNVLWRYFQLSFITHIPCSFECEHSERVAYQRGRIMENVDEDAAHALKDWLDQPHSWSGHNGLAHIKSTPAVAQTQTTPYLQDKFIEWKGEHEPGGKVPGGEPAEGSGVTAPNVN